MYFTTIFLKNCSKRRHSIVEVRKQNKNMENLKQSKSSERLRRKDQNTQAVAMISKLDMI